MPQEELVPVSELYRHRLEEVTSNVNAIERREIERDKAVLGMQHKLRSHEAICAERWKTSNDKQDRVLQMAEENSAYLKKAFLGVIGAILCTALVTFLQ